MYIYCMCKIIELKYSHLHSCGLMGLKTTRPIPKHRKIWNNIFCFVLLKLKIHAIASAGKTHLSAWKIVYRDKRENGKRVSVYTRKFMFSSDVRSKHTRWVNSADEAEFSNL